MAEQGGEALDWVVVILAKVTSVLYQGPHTSSLLSMPGEDIGHSHVQAPRQVYTLSVLTCPMAAHLGVTVIL